MRLTILATLLATCAVTASGCGGGRAPAHVVPPAVASAYPATRWIPASPSFVLAAPSVAAAQRGLRDVADGLGAMIGIDAAELASELRAVLSVDPLSPDALAGMGVDLEGSLAVFSENLDPTVVLHLAAPAQTQTFFDQLRERGLVTQSVIVDGIEVFTAALIRSKLRVSWAVADDWLWLHFTLPFSRAQSTSWFESSRARDQPDWAADWTWAEQAAALARPALVGFFDAQELLGSFVARVPEALACSRLLSPVRRIAVAVDGDGRRMSARLAFDLGPSAAGIAAAILPSPEGFAQAAARAPLAAQWNLDLVAVRGWLHPCLVTLDEDLAWLDRFGVRTARAVLQSFDPDDKSGRGAVALDLVHRNYLAARLDDVPMRSTLERSRTFGPYKGHALSIPFVTTIDYVLTDKLALAAVGDGLLAAVVGAGGSVAGPLAAIDVAPPGLSPEAWTLIFGAIDLPRLDRVVERLLRWRDGHVAITIEGSSLVIAGHGTRR